MPNDLHLDIDAALAGPPPHPNCRCDACEPKMRVRTDMIYGVPVLRKPYGVISMAEARAAFDLTSEECDDYAQQAISEADRGGAPAPVTVQFKFDDRLHDALEQMSSGLLALDNATVREAMRRFTAEEEERVRFEMLTGERPPGGLTAVEVKAAADYYLTTGHLPVLAPPAATASAPAPPAPVQPRPAYRRAMRLRGRLR